MNLTGLYVSKRIIIYWHIFHSSSFHHICNIKCRLDCRYSPQNIFNAKNFNPHNKPISLLNVPICTQGMQRTWWPEAGTIIVTGPYLKMPPYQHKKFHFGDRADVRSSYLHNGISYTGKWTSLYWISLHTINPPLKLKFHKTSFACNNFLIPSNH